MIVFDTNKEIPFFFIHIPQTITYSNFSNFKRLGKFHHGDGGETIPLKNTCKNKVSPPPPGDGGETLPALKTKTYGRNAHIFFVDNICRKKN